MPVDLSRVEEVFSEALNKADAVARAAYLRDACGGDGELCQRVERLLAAHDATNNFLMLLDADPASDGSAPLTEGPGTQIGPYKLLEQIGEGGFGVVFMAEQSQPLHRTVALKIIKPGMDTRQVIARFEAERQALAMMDHPNIARVIDAGTTGGEPGGVSPGRPYFVMDLVKGVPITDYCDQQHLPVRERLELFSQVCQAVQHAHQKGIIHRDLKPSNVLVAEYDGKPVPKIIDFGVAKATAQKLTEKTMFTEFGQMVGTVEYMSPEQARFNQLNVDTRSDIYSLGVLLYELLAGSTPFEGKRLHEAAFDEMLRIIREEEPPKPSTRLSSSDTLPSVAANRHTEPARLSKDVRGDLDWIVMKCLEKDRNRRYETAIGLATDIEHYLRDEAVAACPPSLGYRFKKLVRRNKLAFAAASAVIAALILGLGLSTWLYVEEAAARQRAKTETAKATAISDLLQEMLVSANPDETNGSDYTVRELLDSFSPRLSDQLHDQPEAEAALRATIGNAYRRLGLTDKAAPHLTAALDLRKRVFGPNHVETAQSLLDYAWNLYENKDSAGAEAHAREALALYKRSNYHGTKLIETLSSLQLFLNGQLKYDEAEAVANEALATGRRLFPEGHAELANVLHRLADAAIWQGDPVKSEGLARQSVALHRKLHGDSHPETAWGLYHIGWALQEQQKFEEAEPYYREALAIFRNEYDDSHGSVVQVLQKLPHVLTAQGDEAGLAQLRADTAATMSKSLKRQVDNLRLRAQIGSFLRETGDWEGALAQYSDVIASKPDMADAWSGRAFVYFSRRQMDRAITDYSQAIELAPGVHSNWWHRGHAYLHLAQWDKAAADFTKVIDGWGHEPGGWYWRAVAHAQLNQPHNALADLRQAVAKGFEDVEQLKNNPQLDPLRSREEFASLLQELEPND